jgi:hypothetical protein
MTARAVRVFIGVLRILCAPSHEAQNEGSAVGGILRNNIVAGTQRDNSVRSISCLSIRQ